MNKFACGTVDCGDHRGVCMLISCWPSWNDWHFWHIRHCSSFNLLISSEIQFDLSEKTFKFSQTSQSPTLDTKSHQSHQVPQSPTKSPKSHLRHQVPPNSPSPTLELVLICLLLWLVKVGGSRPLWRRPVVGRSRDLRASSARHIRRLVTDTFHRRWPPPPVALTTRSSSTTRPLSPKKKSSAAWRLDPVGI